MNETMNKANFMSILPKIKSFDYQCPECLEYWSFYSGKVCPRCEEKALKSNPKPIQSNARKTLRQVIIELTGYAKT